MNRELQETPNRRWPWHGWLGLGLVVVFWALNWFLTGLRSHWGFFPLWLGYALSVDATVCYRRGHSMLTRSPLGYAAMFVVSAPAWWLFELLNLRTENWIYDGRELFSDWEYFVLASASFSTVMPAVFGTAEMVCTSRWLKRLGPGPKVRPTPKVLLGMFAGGWLMLALMLIWPTAFFPFLWGSVFLIIEPVNVRLGNRSLLDFTAQGNWRPVVALSTGCLICGFFWEMWNYYSYPKWIYSVPFVDFWHIFEMPLLGYLGYLVFPWELYALYHLAAGSVLRSNGDNRTLWIAP